MCKKAGDPNKLSISALAIIGGIFWGGYLFVAALANSAGIDVFWFSDDVFTLVASVYPGITATVTGAFIGLVWGLACGAFCGGVFGAFYNLLIEKVGFTKRI